MAIVFISSTSAELRKEVAESLARKLGYPCLGREELVDQATEAGIPVGKLEMSVIKMPAPSERLARLKERFLTFVTAGICDRAGEKNLIYHGRGGHFLLQNISHVFRIRLVPNRESRIQTTMLRLRMDRPQAEKYIRHVDQDIEKWVHLVHGQEINDPRQYDLILNLENMSLANASVALCSMAELPDFRPTPASIRTMEDHCLAAHARLKLALDERTAEADLRVSANEGVVTVTYMPRQSQVAKFIPEVLADLKGIKKVLATMAETNILWIQETFTPQSETFTQLNQIAQRWGAAIELLRFIPSLESGDKASEETPPVLPSGRLKEEGYAGGIGEDLPEIPESDDGGLKQTMEEIIRQGRSGGSHTLAGNFQVLSSAISRNMNYSLVVMGDLFLSKAETARPRMIRDLKSFLGERIRVPVISADELQEKYLFSRKQLVKFLTFLAVVVGIYGAVFTNQEPILTFIQKYKGWNLLSLIAIGLFTPLLAYLYGTVAHLFLKMIKFD